MNRNAALTLIFATTASLAHAVEGFENVNQLFTTGDWSQSNLSNPVPPTNTDPWQQGLATTFPAASGTPSSYIVANYSATGVDPNNTGTISAWLFAPTQTFRNGDQVQFFTRTATGSAFADRLQVRLSTSGASTFVGNTETSVGNYSTLLADINPTLSATGYPSVWTSYNLTISGLTGTATGRIGFRYFVTDGGSFGNNSNIVGLDSFNVQAVPEPATFAILGLGLAAVARRRRVAR